MNRLPLITAGLCLLNAVCMQPRCHSAPTVAPANIDLIPPGTVVENSPPKPWTHIIVKSQPRVTSGDVRQISSTQIKLASMFFMATLAQVDAAEADGKPVYQLARLASGIGAKVRGRDTIVSPDTTDRLGANVGFLGGIVLGEMYEKQKSVAVVLRSETCAVYDTPNVIRISNKNRTLVLRYAVVVDPATGQLDALCWLIDVDADGRYLNLTGNMQWLEENKVMDCPLYVDKSEYSWGMPSDNAFASMSIPAGKMQFSIKDRQLAALLTKPRWTEAEGAAVEASLRTILQRGRAASNQTPQP